MTTLAKTAFVDQIERLPPLPVVAQRILAAAESPDSSAEDVARALREDPVIAARILRVVNSPFYGAARQITQVSRAVTRLGTIAVRNLVLGICVRKTLSTNPLRLSEHETLWHHSIAVASACELIARHARLRPAEEAFVAGLLHDTGQLAMLMFQPELFRSVLTEARTQPSYLRLESECFGIDHAEAGFQMMTRWGLPESLCQAVRQHHGPETDLDDDSDWLLAVLILGDVFAQQAGFGLDLPVGHVRHVEMAGRRLKLSDVDQVRILHSLGQRVQQATEMLRDEGADTSAPALADDLPDIIWVSSEGSGHASVSQALLKQRGYRVEQLSPAELTRSFSPDDLIVIDLASTDQNTARELSLRLAGRGHRRIVLLDDLGEGVPSRQRDAETGVCRIPRLFTVFDFKWVEEQLRR